MPNDSILMAGHKTSTIQVYPKASEGSPRTFDDVLWWKVTYKRTLVMRGANWTEIIATDAWNRISIIEK